VFDGFRLNDRLWHFCTSLGLDRPEVFLFLVNVFITAAEDPDFLDSQFHPNEGRLRAHFRRFLSPDQRGTFFDLARFPVYLSFALSLLDDARIFASIPVWAWVEDLFHVYPVAAVVREMSGLWRFLSADDLSPDGDSHWRRILNTVVVPGLGDSPLLAEIALQLPPSALSVALTDDAIVGFGDAVALAAQTDAMKALCPLLATVALSDEMIDKLLSGEFENERVLLVLTANCTDPSQLERIVLRSLDRPHDDFMQYSLIFRDLFSRVPALLSPPIFERIMTTFCDVGPTELILLLANADVFCQPRVSLAAPVLLQYPHPYLTRFFCQNRSVFPIEELFSYPGSRVDPEAFLFFLAAEPTNRMLLELYRAPLGPVLPESMADRDPFYWLDAGLSMELLSPFLEQQYNAMPFCLFHCECTSAWTCAFRILFTIGRSIDALALAKGKCTSEFEVRPNLTDDLPAFFAMCAILFRAVVTGDVGDDWRTIARWIASQLAIVCADAWTNPSVDSPAFFPFCAFLAMLQCNGPVVTAPLESEIAWNPCPPLPFQKAASLRARCRPTVFDFTEFFARKVSLFHVAAPAPNELLLGAFLSDFAEAVVALVPAAQDPAAFLTALTLANPFWAGDKTASLSRFLEQLIPAAGDCEPILEFLCDRIGDGTFVCHINVALGALTTFMRPPSERILPALDRLFRRFLEKPLPDDPATFPPMLVNFERCVAFLQPAERMLRAIFLACLEKAREHPSVDAEFVQRIIETAGAWGSPGRRPAEKVVAVEQIADQIRVSAEQFCRGAFIDGETVRRKRVAMLGELLRIDAECLQAIGGLRRYGGRKPKHVIEPGILEKVFRIVFGIPDSSKIVKVRLNIGELFATYGMVESGEDVLLIWWGVEHESPMANLIDSLVPEDADWFNGHAVLACPKDGVLDGPAGVLKFTRGLQVIGRLV
jgi:hypothetical protein